MTNSNRAKIRLAIARDAERLAIMCEQLGYPSSPEEVQLRLAQIPQDDRDAVYVAERADGLVIGWVHVLVCQLVMCDRLAEIGGLVVEESDRLSGVGRILMQKAEEWARSKGCVTIQLRSNVIRKEAHNFYTSIGYRNIKTSLTFCKVL